MSQKRSSPQDKSDGSEYRPPIVIDDQNGGSGEPLPTDVPPASAPGIAGGWAMLSPRADDGQTSESQGALPTPPNDQTDAAAWVDWLARFLNAFVKTWEAFQENWGVYAGEPDTGEPPDELKTKGLKLLRKAALVVIRFGDGWASQFKQTPETLADLLEGTADHLEWGEYPEVDIKSLKQWRAGAYRTVNQLRRASDATGRAAIAERQNTSAVAGESATANAKTDDTTAELASPDTAAAEDRRPKVGQAAWRAAASYGWICREHPELMPDPPHKYSSKMWAYINEHGCPAYTDGNGEPMDVPAFESWKRQVRKGQQDPSDAKASPRYRRGHGRSIVPRTQI